MTQSGPPLPRGATHPSQRAGSRADVKAVDCLPDARKKLDDVQLLSRSSTRALQARQAGSDDLARIVVIPEHAPAHHTNDSPNLPTGQEEQEGPSRRASSFQFRRTRRKRAAESILSSIRRHYATVVDVSSYVGLGLVLYAALYLLLGKVMLPPKEGWGLFLLWVCAHIGGFTANKVNLPPLLGMLVAGIILRNIPQDPVHEVPTSWGTKLRTGGLAVILLRAGLKIDKLAFARAGKVVLRLALFPMLFEALVNTGSYYWLFSMPIALAFTAGFIQSAISPTVLVTGMLELQRRGYGEAKIIPSIEMAAAGLDSIGAIVGYAVCSGISITSGSLVYSILSGPLQVVYGLILGLVGCFICSLTRIWNNGFKRTTAVLFCGLAIMWLGLKLNYLGASSVGCLSLTFLVSLAWERGFPPRLCKGPKKYYPKDADSKLSVVWLILVQPLLFGAIGIEIDFRLIQGSLIWKTVIILALGMVCTRLPTAFLVLFRGGFTWREQVFMACSWTPKATIQGALGSAPLMLIQTRLKGRPDYAQYEVWGNQILHATAFSIILSAPIGLLVIALLGPLWLKEDKPRASIESFHEVHHPHSRSLSAASDGDDSLPDDTLASAFVDSLHQQSRGADMAMVNGIPIPVPGTDGYVQTPVPVTIDGQTQAHVVIASRQQLPHDATVVPAQFISPFAASTLQARAASSASSQ
ncbi:TPA: hypothetical protein ACH3X3_007414 [Trebouxia sp. C0006]